MLKIDDLSLKLNNKEILKNINLNIKENKITGIIGKNASSKTSLIRCINGIYSYNGKIYFKDKLIKEYNLKDLAKKISYLPQLLKYPHILTSEILKMGRSPYTGLNERLGEEDKEIINKTIERFQIEPLLDKYLDELSGGQRQLIYFAMQIIQDADLLILDEPTSFMDINFENLILKTLKELNELENKTIVIVMHNINKIIKYVDELVVLDNGEVSFVGSVNDCINNKVIEKVFNLKKYQFGDTIIYEE